ncbi:MULTISPECIES: glycosyltransferase [Priestia]|uniref:glycosyltransferase n=1 Tax=Priestia TaxID=2800373 RepID=UPI00112D434B|nr:MULTISPECIES: glycosyltransferase [Priestia]
MYKISVILPIYNVEKHIDYAIKSLIGQTIGFENLEIILVNDGSTDHSGSIIDYYANEYSNIQALHFDFPSGAAGRPRNAGLELASAKYVMFLDPDDSYLPETCELLLSYIEGNSSDMVVGKTEGVTAAGPYEIPLGNPQLKDQHINVRIEQLPSLLQEFIHLNSIIYKTSIIKENKLTFMEGRATQDALFTEQVLLKAENITFIPKVVYRYHAREDLENPSMTQNRNLKYFEDLAYMVEISKGLYDHHVLNYLEARYPSLIGWTLFQFERITTDDEQEKLNIINTIKPIIDLAKDFDTSILAKDKQQLIEFFMNYDVPAIFRCMNKIDGAVDIK